MEQQEHPIFKGKPGAQPNAPEAEYHEGPADEVIEPEVKPDKPVDKVGAIAVHNGVMMPSNHVELTRVLARLGEGGAFPKRFDTDAKRLAAYNMAVSINPARWQIIVNGIADIEGQLCLFGELPGALAEWTGEMEQRELYVIDKDYKRINVANKNLNEFPFAGVLEIKRKGRPTNQFFYTMKEAEAAGQYPAMKAEWKDNKRTGKMIPNTKSPWMTATKVMLMRKALNMGIKFEFPDAIMSTPVAEWDHDAAPDIKDVTGSDRNVKSDEINQTFGGTDAKP